MSMIDSDEDKDLFEGLYLKYRKHMKYIALQIPNFHAFTLDQVIPSYFSRSVWVSSFCSRKYFILSATIQPLLCKDSTLLKRYCIIIMILAADNDAPPVRFGVQGGIIQLS
jgi:hypothetical protein